MNWDAKGFTAALINLAAKGFVKISEFEENKYKFTRTGQNAKQTHLSPGETVVASALFGDNTWNSFVFRSENHAISDRARKTIRRSLKEDFELAVRDLTLLQKTSLCSTSARPYQPWL